MTLPGEKEIRAYRLVSTEVVCPECASAAEKADPATHPVPEDAIHDESPEMACPVCGSGEAAVDIDSRALERESKHISGPEDAIHDSGPMKCVRCQKVIQ